MRNFLRLVLPIAATAGALFASTLLWVAFQNNNQGEFFDTLTGRPDWGYDLVLWFVLFAPVFLMVAVPGAIAVWLRAIARDR